MSRRAYRGEYGEGEVEGVDIFLAGGRVLVVAHTGDPADARLRAVEVALRARIENQTGKCWVVHGF